MEKKELIYYRLDEVDEKILAMPVSYTHLTLPTIA